jgi:c-di-GMP phosphodiesterase
MQEYPVLGHVLVGHAPVIDRQRAVVATRLIVFCEDPASPPDARELLAAVCDAFPPPGDGITLTLRPLETRGGSVTASPSIPPVLLHLGHEGLLRAVVDARPPPHLMLEIPAFMLADPALARAVGELQMAGQPLAIFGRPVDELPHDLLPLFRHAIVELGADRRAGAADPGGARRIATLSAGVRTLADVDRALQQGAHAVIGWPVEGEVQTSGRRGLAPDLHAIVELMKRVDNEDPAERMEPVLKTDPTLAFRLLRYINSAAFGLRVEVTSFKHALMLLGYVRLKRWLALLLAGASKDPTMRPLMHAAVRRGFLMEELARGVGDEEMRSEMFICGVFSLLDRMLRQPFDELLDNVPVPERVRASLLGADGPYGPHLDLARAVEQGSPVDIRECADRLLIGTGEVSRAVFAALATARQID